MKLWLSIKNKRKVSFIEFHLGVMKLDETLNSMKLIFAVFNEMIVPQGGVMICVSRGGRATVHDCLGVCVCVRGRARVHASTFFTQTP